MGVVDGRAVLSELLTLPNGPWTMGLCAILGANIGSYCATLALRWPEGRSASSGRSQCDGCGRPLRWFELVPILAYCVAHGRCRRCAAPIARLHIGVELGAAMLGALAAAVTPDAGSALALAVLFWQLLLLAVLDQRHLWLPDRLTLLLAVSGVALGGLVSDAPIFLRAAAMVGAFAALELIRRAFLFLRGKEGMGAGDPKLFGAIAAWTGPFALPFILLMAAAIGLIMAFSQRLRGRPMAAFPFGAYLAMATMAFALTAL